MSARRKIRSGLVVVGVASISAVNARADAFDAGAIMNKMSADERSAFLAGVVEGLAIARYNKDGKQKAGMGCIYDWFYKDKQTLRTIHEAFDRFPTYPPGSIVDVMVKRKCGE